MSKRKGKRQVPYFIEHVSMFYSALLEETISPAFFKRLKTDAVCEEQV